MKVIVLLATLLSIVALLNAQTCSSVSGANKIDCGYVGIDQTQCQAKGCCWIPVNPNPSNEPWCFFLNDTCTINWNASSPGFSSSDIATMQQNFYANLNIDGKGGVLASPDTDNGPGGSYYFHWMRDGALSMRSYMKINGFNLSTVQSNMNQYVQWVLNAQSASDPNGIDVRTEPKFNLPNGGVFSGGWCRPQDDGPSLRSTTLMEYANQLISAGQNSTVTQYLWTGSSSSYNGGAIKFDLDWVANNFIGTQTCDLWEEIRNTEIFWNYMVARRALLMGATFATQMGDSASASTYSSAASNIQNAIESTFWTGEFYMEANNRQKDAAVIIAFNRGFNNDNFLTPVDPKVAATVNVLNTLFCNTYPINQADTTNGIPGILYGRYAGDTYFGGNPWILTSAGLAQLFYNGANYVLNQGSVSSDVLTAWANVFPNVNTGTSYTSFAQTLAYAGNSILQRIHSHVSSENFNLYEQIDKTTGAQTSAYSLSWSYANVLVALTEWNQYQNNVALLETAQ